MTYITGGTMFKTMLTMPARMMSRMADVVTGGNKVNIDSHTEVRGDDASRWADRFEKDPTAISPMTVNARREGNTTKGQPFPMGPDIGITVTERREAKTRDGRGQTTLDIRYSGDFAGPGRITVTEKGNGKLDVRDQWNGVDNYSPVPSRAAEIGHPVVAGMGFRGYGD